MSKVSAKQAAENAAQRHVRQAVMERAGYRCEVVLAETLGGEVRCPRRAWEPHHVTKRSQGGEDSVDNEIAVCRDHHDRTDWPWARGRLVVVALGSGRFACALATSKTA